MIWKLDFNVAVEIHRLALLRVLAGLLAMIDNDAALVVPRHVKYRLLRLLRPAEAAARRLVFVLVQRCHNPPTLPPCGGDVIADDRGGCGSKVRAATPLCPLGISPTRGGSGACGARSFQLFDPLKRFDINRRIYTKNPPRIWNFNDPHQVFTPVPQKPEPTVDDELSAASIIRRMKALEIALSDLSAQAKRLAKIQARRERPISKTKRIAIMRPGFPPGHRRRHRYEIDAILKECHALACYARERERPG